MSTALKRIGATPGKLAVVGLLCAVMAVVWWQAIAGSVRTSTSKAAAAKSSAASSEATASVSQSLTVKNDGGRASSQTPADTKTVVADWPKLPLADAIKNDPFAKPGWAILRKEPQMVAKAEAGDAANEAVTREELLQQGTKLIVISGERKVATIGDREVTIGDTLGEYKVLDITSRGVVLSDVPEGG